MKKILAALAVLSTLALVGCGDNTGTVSTSNPRKSSPNVRIICVGNYAFAFFTDYKKGGITQIWENGPNGPRPMMCEKGGEE